MNALRAAQWQYDNQLPPAVSDDGAAEAEWIDKHAAELVLGYRVSWGFRSDRGEVTQADLARAVQDHINQRQIDGLDVKDAIGQLVLAGMGTGSAGVILGLCTYLLGGRDTLKEIAADLLRPHAANAVVFEREQERLEQECGF